jgi:hypothetical protein
MLPDSQLVAKIVKSIKTLEVLEYEQLPLCPMDEPWINNKPWADNTWADIAVSLNKHTRTLSSLRFLHFADWEG